jgi:hypothetical protein
MAHDLVSRAQADFANSGKIGQIAISRFVDRYLAIVSFCLSFLSACRGTNGNALASAAAVAGAAPALEIGDHRIHAPEHNPANGCRAVLVHRNGDRAVNSTVVYPGRLIGE